MAVQKGGKNAETYLFACELPNSPYRKEQKKGHFFTEI